MYNPYSLLGKTILVTGASSGIGQATAIECSKLGAKVIITARNEERLQVTYNQLEGEGHKQIIADLTSQDGIERLLSSFDTISGLVLCAGKGLTMPVQFCTRDKFDDIFDINFFAPVEILRLCVKKRKLDKGSSVVFVSSIGGVETYLVGNSVYGASKAALTSTMKYYAREVASKKIRVNGVNPGMVDTKFIYRGQLTDDQFIYDMERYPLKRYGKPIDVAMGVIYLLSDASSWVTGISLVIDGGVSI